MAGSNVKKRATSKTFPYLILAARLVSRNKVNMVSSVKSDWLAGRPLDKKVTCEKAFRGKVKNRLKQYGNPEKQQYRHPRIAEKAYCGPQSATRIAVRGIFGEREAHGGTHGAQKRI